MAAINLFVKVINEHLSLITPILVMLIASLITIRYREIIRKRDKFESDYSKFKKAFSAAIDQLESRDTIVNIIILEGFPKHNMAKRDFIHHLHGLRKRRFLKKWKEYDEKYQEIKSLGIFGFGAAIAPSVEALNNCKSSQEVDTWEHDREIQLLKIIHELLAIAKKKIWF